MSYLQSSDVFKRPYTRTLNHPILQDGRKVTILLKQRRWKCTNPVCGHFETEQFSFVERYKHNTNMTDFMIVEDFRSPSLSAAEIARRRNVSDTYAIYTFARYVDMDRLPLTEAISVDEVHLKISRYCNYALVIQDFITGDPIDLVADRKKTTTEPYYDARMSRYMTTLDYEEELFKIDPVFKKLRDLKEIYIKFNNRYVGKPKEAAAGLRAVIQHYRKSDLKIFYKYIADTLEEYFDEIVNSFIVLEKYSKDGKHIVRLSNGPMESLNRIPKDLKRNARGYRNFEHIRQRFLFSQRSSAAVRANPKPLEDVLFKTNLKRGPYVKKAYRSFIHDSFS